MWSIALLVIFVRNTWAFSSLANLESDPKLLSRQRRFLVPEANSDWTFKVDFKLNFPLEGLDTNFEGKVPFSFTFSPSR